LSETGFKRDAFGIVALIFSRLPFSNTRSSCFRSAVPLDRMKRQRVLRLVEWKLRGIALSGTGAASPSNIELGGAVCVLAASRPSEAIE
jgi:hypothetical protein